MAERDLDGIHDYTTDRWGIDQAERYLRGLRTACGLLAAGELPSRPAGLGAGIRRYRWRSHMLFFRVCPEEILIIRILHARMEALRHLPDDDTQPPDR